MSKQLHLIVVGKLKDPHFEAIEKDFLKRINTPELIIHEVKASAENKEIEGEMLLKKIKEISPTSSPHIIALSEWGKKMTSTDFANWTADLIERPQKVVFVIAGAEGFSEQFLKTCQEKISLSALTFPHKFARLLIIEQLYRAQTIRQNHPYHN
ncbi:MAG: 23S rRNA (pseudouridine(1915)-N(3))-methyltransferase RlmH [Bacteriovoracaceae bacterium]